MYFSKEMQKTSLKLTQKWEDEVKKSLKDNPIKKNAFLRFRIRKSRGFILRRPDFWRAVNWRGKAGRLESFPAWRAAWQPEGPDRRSVVAPVPRRRRHPAAPVSAQPAARVASAIGF